MMADLTGDADLEEEIRNEAYKAAPHELVSAIVALQVFGNMIKGEKYFYIFYNRKKAKETLSIAGLIDSLLTLSTNASVERRLV